jgi:hypothetical protein
MLRHLVQVAFACLLVGCSDDEVARTPATDTGIVVDTAVAKDTATSDVAPDVVEIINECAESDYIDATTNEGLRKLDPWSVATGKKCLRIKKTQSVTWVPEGGFMMHPLEADSGDAPTPIMLINTGTTATVAFPDAGTYGYHCANHPAIMKGAIRVVP